jgi:excisionase family DNA binding protein
MNTIVQSDLDAPIEKLTVAQAAEMMGVCERTVKNWRKEGLRLVKIGRKSWILTEDLRAFVEAHRTAEGA